ncbi:lysine-tRNA ligase [Phytophthora cinnamomi]|uniref:lysine-tRNA ligase n=1 Tax=Phytophthora cinnamomi TaxID=4785 RepID=UPI00355ABDFC|nr:lysine-tRNA ligase [Phytophthora cinnamomi]
MMLRNVWLRHGASARRLLSTAAPSASAAEAMERFQSVPKFQQYPYFFPVSMSLQEYQRKFEALEPKARCTEESVALAGRIVAIRHASKNLVFLDLQSDGHTVQVLSEVKHFQGRGDDAAAGDNEAVKKEFRTLHESLRRGDIVGVKGFPGKSGKGELSIIPRQLEVLAPCIQPFPNSKYGIKEPEIRFRKKYLDLLTNPGVRPIFETRAQVVRGIRRYLEDRNFMEVETPMLFSAAGGAAAQPFVTNSRALGKDLYLRIAPELFLKQLVIGGFDRVFEIGKVFRNEGIDATHNPEFTICEFYQAYADYNTLMGTAEEMISGIAKDVTGSYKIQYPMEDADAEEEEEEGAEDEPTMVEIDFTPPFKRLPILETLEECLGEKLPDVNSPESIPALLELCERHNVECAKPHTCTRLVDKLIGHFVEPKCVNPTFLYNHPTCMSPLAKAHREQQGVTERFELFVAGKELCNAYTELNDPFDQRRRFAAQQADQQRGDSEAHGKDDEFCTALEYGLPPTGGFGIGVDRLVMLLSGKPHIREVIMFPAMKPKDDVEL